jgi:hypothetical protein
VGRVPRAIIDNRDKPTGWRRTAFWCGKNAVSRGQLAVCINKDQMQGYQGRGHGARKGGMDGSDNSFDPLEKLIYLPLLNNITTSTYWFILTWYHNIWYNLKNIKGEKYVYKEGKVQHRRYWSTSQ